MPTDESADLIELTRDIVDKELRPQVDQAEREHSFPREVFRTLGRAGLLSLPYPETYGGGGQPYEVYLQVLEEIASAWAAVGVGTSVHALSCFGLFYRGTEEQKRRWLPDMLGGELLGAYCLSEAHAGSDPAAMRTRAVRDGDDYILTGSKYWITNAGISDVYVVFAKTDPDGGGRGISCFLVERDWGITIAKHEDKLGMRGSPTGEVVLDEVRVPATHRIGEEGQGFTIAMHTLDRSRPTIGAQAVGIAQGAIDYAASYMKQRHAFGGPISDLQGLRFMLADMAMRNEAARALIYRACSMVDHDPDGELTLFGAMAKAFASDTSMSVTVDAVQLLGGYGYTKDFPVERFLRDAKVTQIYEGTNQVQRVVIARELLKNA
jgi:alkylation response protein AidB-like acyl-CoA dehydrogenase